MTNTEYAIRLYLYKCLRDGDQTIVDALERLDKIVQDPKTEKARNDFNNFAKLCEPIVELQNQPCGDTFLSNTY